MDKFDKYIH